MFRNELSESNKEIDLDYARSIADHIYSKCIIDPSDRFHHFFFHEVCPMIAISEQVRATSVRFCGSDSRFDGEVHFNGTRQRVELTAALDGHNVSLILELLKQRGHAPAFQKIEFFGNKRNRIFGENKLIARRMDDYTLLTLKPLLSDALIRKVGKSLSNANYEGAWLGIVFDDYAVPAERRAKYLDHVCKLVLRTGKYAPFTRVFFVGVSRQYLFDSKSLVGSKDWTE